MFTLIYNGVTKFYKKIDKELKLMIKLIILFKLDFLI